VLVFDWSTSSPTHTVVLVLGRRSVFELRSSRPLHYIIRIVWRSVVWTALDWALTYLPFTSVQHSRTRSPWSVECACGCRHMPLCTYIDRSSTNTYTRAHSSPFFLSGTRQPTASINCGRRHMSALFSSPFTCFILIPESPAAEYWKIRQIRMLPDSD